MSAQCCQQGGGKGCSTGKGSSAFAFQSWKSWTLAFDPGRGRRTCHSQSQESKRSGTHSKVPLAPASSTATPQRHPSPGKEEQILCPQDHSRQAAAGWHPLPTPSSTHIHPSTSKSTSSSCQATCSGKEKLHLQDIFILRLPTRRQLAPGEKLL